MNKYTATRKTESGKIVEVTVENGTTKEEVMLDGSPTGTYKINVISNVVIALKDVSSKTLMTGRKIDVVDAGYKNSKELIAKGAVARLGDAYITQEIVNLINDAITEAQASAPKTEDQIALENKSKAEKESYEKWYNSAEQVAYRKFEREMNCEDSDY